MLNVNQVYLPHHFKKCNVMYSPLGASELAMNRSRLTRSCLVRELGRSRFCSEHEASVGFENQARGCIASPQ